MQSNLRRHTPAGLATSRTGLDFSPRARRVTLALVPSYRNAFDHAAHARGDTLVATGRPLPASSAWCGWTPTTVWYTTRGSIRIETSDYVATLGAGRAVVTEHGARVRVTFAGASSEVCAILLAGSESMPATRVDRGVAPLDVERLVFPERIDDDALVLGSIARFAQRATSGSQVDADAFAHLVHLLVDRQSRHRARVERCTGRTSVHRADQYLRLSRARVMLEENIASPLSLTDLARVARMSPTHFLRAYRRAFGQTPHRHSTSLRLDEARRLLAESTLAVSEVARAIGFDRCAFTRAFRAYHGIAPVDVRRMSDAGGVADAAGAGATPSRWEARP